MSHCSVALETATGDGSKVQKSALFKGTMAL